MLRILIAAGLIGASIVTVKAEPNGICAGDTSGYSTLDQKQCDAYFRYSYHLLLYPPPLYPYPVIIPGAPGGDAVGSDPDPNIRSQIIRDYWYNRGSEGGGN